MPLKRNSEWEIFLKRKQRNKQTFDFWFFWLIRNFMNRTFWYFHSSWLYRMGHCSVIHIFTTCCLYFILCFANSLYLLSKLKSRRRGFCHEGFLTRIIGCGTICSGGILLRGVFSDWILKGKFPGEILSVIGYIVFQDSRQSR